MIQRLTAVQYRQTLLSGHSCPCLMEAESLEAERHEVVLKLRGSIQGGVAGLARELVASQLATKLGLKTPTPFLVELSHEFVESVSDPAVRERFSQNLGWHYAGTNLAGSWYAIPYGSRLPYHLMEAATAVLAFDALLRNDDRHVEKTNYLMQGSTVMVIDHERAFPSPQPGTGPRPWEDGGLTFLRKHAFFAGLKGQLPDFEPISNAFEAITEDQLSALAATIPAEWESGGITGELEGYLMALKANFPKVMHSLRTLLQ